MRRCGLRAVGGLPLDHGGLEVAVDLAGERVLELAHAAAQRAAELGQLLRADDQKGDGEDDDEFHGTDRRHVRLLVSAGVARVREVYVKSGVRRAGAEATNRPAWWRDPAHRVAGSARGAPAARGPDARDGAPDDARRGDRAEVARVLRVGTVVAHEEDRAGADLDRPEVDAVDRLVVHERLADAPAIDHEDAVLEPDRVAADGDDALEQDLAAVARRVQRDELAALGVVAGELVDERLVAGLERRLHALARDPERLGDEDADQQEERDQRDPDGDPGRAPAPGGRGGLIGRRRGRRGGGRGPGRWRH